MYNCGAQYRTKQTVIIAMKLSLYIVK